MCIRRLSLLAILPALTLALALAACDPAGEPADAVTANGAPAPLPGPATLPPAPAGDFQTGEAVVRALYAEPSTPTEAATIRRYFAEALVAGLTPPQGEVGPVDFDYRLGGQEGSAAGLAIDTVASGPTGGIVTARFFNLGVAKTITWTVCRQDDGALRIVDAQFTGAADQEPWNLRQLLDLPKRPDAC